MKRTSRMVFLRLFICFILFMTACQASSPTKKAGAHKDHDSEDQFRRDYPTLDIRSNTVKGQKNGAIFEGSVELKRGQLVKFFADYISIELSENNGGYYIIQMKGNVSMVTGGLIIKSQEATSSDFRICVDFVGNVTLSDKGVDYRTDWVRYYFLQGYLQFKWDDVPTRGHLPEGFIRSFVDLVGWIKRSGSTIPK